MGKKEVYTYQKITGTVDLLLVYVHLYWLLMPSWIVWVSV